MESPESGARAAELTGLNWERTSRQPGSNRPSGRGKKPSGIHLEARSAPQLKAFQHLALAGSGRVWQAHSFGCCFCPGGT